jgi:hypothetical protein
MVAASCATYEWRNPNVPEQLWRRDEADCVGRAAAKVEEEAAREERYGGGGATARDDRGTAREIMMVRFEMKKRQARLVENCMRAKGYGKAEAE